MKKRMIRGGNKFDNGRVKMNDKCKERGRERFRLEEVNACEVTRMKDRNAEEN